MTTKLAAAGTIKEGSFIVVEGAACRVVDVSHSKTGKHGSSKVRIVSIGIIDSKKRDIVMPASDNIEVPIIEKKSAQVLSISGSNANVMDSETYETFDLEIPEELKATVTEGSQVLYWIVLSQKVMKQLKSAGE